MSDQPRVQVGHIYRHFKGSTYLVLHLAKDSETQEELVIYRSQHGHGQVWARPLAMFFDEVEGGRRRFELVREEAVRFV